MNFPHRIRLSVLSPVDAAGVQDPHTGVFTFATPDNRVVFYDGEADVQETARRLRKGDDGETSLDANAVAYLAETDVFKVSSALVVAATHLKLQTNVLADITWEDGAMETAEVAGVRRLDGAVLLRRVGGA